MRFMCSKFYYASAWLFFFITEVLAQGPDTLWTRAYGGGNVEYGYSVKQTFDGGFIAVGITKSYGNGGYDIWLLKLNADGDTIWTKTYGGPYDEAGYSVLQHPDGGYIVAGWKTNDSTDDSDIWLLKTDINGDTIWTRSYGGYHNEYGGYSVQLTTDGGYIIAGKTYSFGQGVPMYSNIYLVKTDANGHTLWTKVYGQDGLVDDIAYGVIQTSDGGYIICGCTGLQTQYDIYLLKTDANGDTVWTKKYGGSGQEVGYSIIESDGAYIVAGYTNSYGPHPSNFYLLKIDASGDTIWTKVYDGGYDEHGHSVQQTYDGGYIIAGYSGDDIFLVRTDADGNPLWTKTYPKADHSDVAYEVQQTTDNGYIIVGYTHYWYYGKARAYEDIYLIKTEPEGGIEEKGCSKHKKTLFKIIPNPMTSSALIECYLSKSTLIYINIYNILGQKVRQILNKTEGPGTYRMMWSGYDDYNNKVPAGVYFVEYNGLVKKLVKVR